MKLTSVEIKFGSIALSKAKNIQVLYKGFELQIEEIALKSNFFNSEISNPLQIFIRDVRINKNVDNSDSEEVFTRKIEKSSSNEPIKQIPSFLVTFFQVRQTFPYLASMYLLILLFLVHGHKCFERFLVSAQQFRAWMVAAYVSKRV